MKNILRILFIALLGNADVTAGEVPLDSLNLANVRQGWGNAASNKSVGGKPLTIGGQKFERGIGTHAVSVMYLRLQGQGQRFTASVGVDDEVAGQPASVEFQVIGDDKVLWESGLMKAGTPPRKVSVELGGVKTLVLVVEDGEDGIASDHADWADARVAMLGESRPEVIAMPVEEAVILTPKRGLAPCLHGPKIYGCRPGHPFFYRVPCTGERPLSYSAQGLPAGLKLDSQTGIITGTTPERGEYAVKLQAQNRHGKSERRFKLVAGDKLALTPPMGFNDWYAYLDHVTDAKMRYAADTMIANGMVDAGYQYVNVDDCWMGKRSADGNLAGNEKFPDMKGLADYIHSQGLKAGLYTSPGPKTCAGYEGSYQHEAQDARRFAEWGFDFLKYDWCSYRSIAPNAPELADYQKPYRQMGDLLAHQDRDIVFNLCQYGMGDVWKWGAAVGGHAWRTSDDLGIELNRVFQVALKNCGLRDYHKPGEWNDPDYIQIGWFNNTKAPFTPSESYSFMALWCLMAAPLFYSGDMERLDEFTLSILCNPEVIEVDQDPLGQCARVVDKHRFTFVLVKDLEDGSKAVGLCNSGEVAADVAAQWKDLGVTGPQMVRDLWQEKDLGEFTGHFSRRIPRHGVVLVRLNAKETGKRP